MVLLKHRNFTQILSFIILFTELNHVDARVHHKKDPEERLALFEGDIIPKYDEIRDDYSTKFAKELVTKGLIDPEEEIESEEFVALGSALTSHRWTDRVEGVVQIPYTYQSGSFSSTEQSKIEQAIRDLEDAAGVIKFVKKTNEPNYILVLSDRGCYSYVGNVRRGPQKLSLQKGGCVHHGVIQHEFIHALGFYHEQSRPDRDQYVTINNGNIRAGAENNFKERSNSNTLGTPYDYQSVMHYGATYFTNNGRPTITTKTGEKIGQRKGATDSDLEKIRLLYQCKSGPRSLNDYKANMCTSDCPCWLDAVGCNKDSACQGSMVCKNSKCIEGPKGATASPTPSPKVECVDKNSSCFRWAKSGYCQGQHYTFMSVYCRSSCKLCDNRLNKDAARKSKTCKDKYRENCFIWEKMNYCNEKYVHYMRKNCKKTCGLCG